MRRLVLMTLVHVAVALLLGLAALFVFYGRENTWALAFGKADLGRAGFETLVRRTASNDALLCPPGFCPKAVADAAPPVFDMPVDELRRRLRERLVSEPLLVRTADYPDAYEERYVARTRLLRFPDTVDVRYIEVTRTQSTLALYSRSQIGRHDWGVNRARLDRWIALLQREDTRAE